MDSANDLEAIGISPKRRRGWAVFSLILAIAIGGFVLGYYVPLYRAHARLLTEYQGQSKESKLQRQQLISTVETLKEVSEQKDQLSEVVRKEQEAATAAKSRAEALYQSLQAPLKRYLSKGWLKLEQNEQDVRATLLGPALVSADGEGVTAQGKKALCLVATALKSTNLSIVVRSLGVRTQDDTAWAVAATRAADAARVLGETCAFDASRIEVRLTKPTTDPSGTVVLLELGPRPSPSTSGK